MFPAAHGVVSQLLSGGEDPGGGEEHALPDDLVRSGTIGGTDARGWEFQVGEHDIEARSLRIRLHTGGSIENVRLYRVSDEALLAEVSITSAAREWAEAPLDTPVILASSENYALTTYSSVSRTLENHTSPAGIAMNPAVTYVRGRWWTSNAFPSSTLSARLQGFVDIGFVIL